MYTRKYILLFLFTAFCFTDCKKYPEGPAFSLRTKKQRVTGGWEIETFLINGADSTTTLPRSPFNSIYPCYYTFGPSGSNRDYTIGGACENGIWSFSEDKTKINIDITAFSIQQHSAFLTDGPISWDIQRLTNKQMWLKANNNGSEYWIKFKKIEK